MLLVVTVLFNLFLSCSYLFLEYLAIQELVNQSKRILNGNISEGDTIPSFYSKKVASRNIKTIAVNSVCLLEVLRDIMFDSTLEDRGYLKVFGLYVFDVTFIFNRNRLLDGYWRQSSECFTNCCRQLLVVWHL